MSFSPPLKTASGIWSRRGKIGCISLRPLWNALWKAPGTLKHLRLADDSVCGKFHIKDRDASKIVVNTVRCAFTGTEAAEILRRRFRLEPEMACGSYLLLMTSLMDTEDGFRRLEEALRYLDSLEAAGGGEDCGSDDCGGPGPDDRDTGTKTALTWLAAPEKKRKLSEAWGSERRSVCLQDAAGAVSGGFITVYPPGGADAGTRRGDNR